MLARDKNLEQMLGESLREMGVLVLVFHALSAFITVEGLGWRELVGAVVAALIATATWLIGAHLELRE